MIAKGNRTQITNSNSCCGKPATIGSNAQEAKDFVKKQFASVVQNRSCGCSKQKDALADYFTLEGYTEEPDYGLGLWHPR